MHYPNNGFKSYVDELYKSYHPAREMRPRFLVRLIIMSPVILWQILKDAGIELFFLLIFWGVIMKMSQGRDMIVSLFEPEGLYGVSRIVLTLLSVVSFALSMWLIPAFLFQKREQLTSRASSRDEHPFEDHLFFAHRVLPLFPFWVLAAALFNGVGHYFLFPGFKGVWQWFVLSSIAEVLLLFFFNHKVKSPKLRWTIMAVVAALLAGAIIYFCIVFQVRYTEAKLALAIILYLLSAVLFFLFHEADRKLLDQYRVAMKEGRFHIAKYPLNSTIYFICAGIHACMISLITWWPRGWNIAPESLLLYILSAYIFIIDLIFYLINLTRARRVAAAGIALLLLILLISPVWNLNANHHRIMANDAFSPFDSTKVRSTFDERYNELRQRIIVDSSGEPYPIVLVSGQGGGSRAGMWFSQVLINMDIATEGRIRDHIFSISTVSGSSVGLSTLLSYWDKTQAGAPINSRWRDVPGKVFANNFVGSSVRGVFLTDVVKSFWPFETDGDRNTLLQVEEALRTEQAIHYVQSGHLDLDEDIPVDQQTLRRDFMSFFYDTLGGQLRYRSSMPIVMINSCRSNDGRRGIISSVQLNDTFFNDAIDIGGYLYEKEIYCQKQKVCDSRRKKISLGQACNTSELFPIFSAPLYMDSLGSFVDGGYHENSGLKTTMDVYLQLKMKLDRDPAIAGRNYRIYILYLKNGAAEKELYKPLRNELSIAQPLVALFNQPFQGSESYFEERALVLPRVDSHVVFIRKALKPSIIVDTVDAARFRWSAKDARVRSQILRDLIGDIIVHDGKTDTVLNFPLARWLSNTVVKRIRQKADADDSVRMLTAIIKRHYSM